jgi:hypothetical protein
MATLTLPSGASPDRLPALLWGAVRIMGIALAGALAMQMSQGLVAQPGDAVEMAAPTIEEMPVEPAETGPRMLDLDRGMQHGDFAWNDAGVPPGRVHIRIDIGAQTLSVFRSGHEIGRAVILYGTDEKPTPTGSFAITEMKEDHVSNLYDAPMPYMLRLTDDGIAIHGSIVQFGSATRGCIGVPDEFAALLFAQARLGDRVTIVNGGIPAA